MYMKCCILAAVLLSSVLSYANDESAGDNPFFRKWTGPYGTPPFSQIKNKHFLPAIEEGIRQENSEISAIAENPEAPSFTNTIEAMQKSGKLLNNVTNVFYNLMSANSDDQMQKIAEQCSPLLSKHNDDIYLNRRLFKRVETLYNKKEKLGLDLEQKNLLSHIYLKFTRSGINLSKENEKEFRKINERIDLLNLRFTQNVLKENSSYICLVDKEGDLKGLPEAVIKAAAEGAKEKGHPGNWAFFLNKPSFIPVLQYASNRALREKLFKAYISRGNNNNEFDNKKIAAQVFSLRARRSNLLGYKSYADYALEPNMAKNPENVYKLLNQIWTPAVYKAKEEVSEMQRIVDKEGGNFKLQPWDWWYYAEKVKNEKYSLDEEMLRPYFKLENVRDGAFWLANKLYGITFTERNDIDVYQKDVKTYEVKDSDGKVLGIYYTDYFPRESKQSGAWCNQLRPESNIGGDHILPLVTNVGNFAKPIGDKPALLSFDDVSTLFHEFGHALDGFFSKYSYPGTNGFSELDVVELPSQLMENFVYEPEVLKAFARHYKTGETIPQELIDKIVRSKRFNQGFETVELLAATYLDMDWHSLKDTKERDIIKFEKESLKKIGLIPEIESRYQTTNYLHIFADGYCAGYYSYTWAQVLDADAFEAFKEKGLFDKDVASAFRNNVLGHTGIEDASILYKRFRGREPRIDALLKRKGME